MFINDLESHLIFKNSSGVSLQSDIDEQFWLQVLVLLYADDTILLAENANDLQNTINHFHEYCKQWKLKVNITKNQNCNFWSEKHIEI